MTNADITIAAPTIASNFDVVEKSPEVSTTVEGALNEQTVRDELQNLWEKHDTNLGLDRQGAEQLRAKTQDRLRGFLVEAYPQAERLIKQQNRDLLNKLIREAKMTPKTTDSGLFIQIAALQIGRLNKDGVFKTPARREERYGLLFRIFADKGWTPQELNAKIKAAGGTSKIIAEDAKDRRDPNIDKKREQYATTAYANPDGVPSVRVLGSDPAKGKWRLALVSVHENEEVRVHTFVGKTDDAATQRAVNDYAEESFAIRDILSAPVEPEAETQNEQAPALLAAG